MVPGVLYYGFSWFQVGFIVCKGSRLVFHGSRWISMTFRGSRWVSMVTGGFFLWVFMVFHGSRLVFHGSR